MPDTLLITEAAALVSSPGPGSRRFEARILAADVQGSSGYYPASTLADAATARVFGKGTKVFVNHPSLSERDDRPERDLEHLAGRLDSDAVMRPDGLYAEVLVYPSKAERIAEMAGDIGLSIRANGTAEQSEVDGERRTVITSITEALSVDFVTAAGAGGMVTRLIESALNPTTPTPPAPPVPPERNSVMEITEADHRRLTEAVQTAETERDAQRARADAAEARLARVAATEAARTRAATALAESTLPPAARARVITDVTRDVPLTDTGALNEAAFDAAVTAAETAMSVFVGSLTEAGSDGRPTGLGADQTNDAELTEADADAAIRQALGLRPLEG